MTLNWKQFINVTETTALMAVGSFLAALSQSGGSFDSKHLVAAGIGALVGFSYKMSGVINNLTTGQSVSTTVVPEPRAAVAYAPSAPVVGPAPVSSGVVSGFPPGRVVTINEAPTGPDGRPVVS